MTTLTKLKALAEAALTEWNDEERETYTIAEARHIVAANPATILKMIELLEIMREAVSSCSREAGHPSWEYYYSHDDVKKALAAFYQFNGDE